MGDTELRGQVKVNSIEILDDATIEDKLEKSLHLRLEERHAEDPELIPKLYALLACYKGESSVYFHIVENREEKSVIRAHNTYSIQPIPELFLRLADLLGDRSVFYSVGEQLKVINKDQVAGNVG